MERLHIAFFGPANSGKSTLVNAIAGQQVSLVSPVPGTTTDPVRKPIELPGLGACVLIDTAGLDDDSILGAERRRLTLAVLDEADVAVYVLPDSPKEESASVASAFRTAADKAGIPVLAYRHGERVEDLIRRINEVRPQEETRFLTGDLVKAGDTVLLVMPQDSEAPKGRLILPQAQVIRELLDRGCTPLCCTPASLPSALASLKTLPALTITDASVFAAVNAALPHDAPLTAFSVLLAATKGDTKIYVEGAKAIDHLRPGARILIAEACTHVPDTEDIGRVKIPALLRKRAAAGGNSSGEHFFSSPNEIPEQRSDERPLCAAAGGNSSGEHFFSSPDELPEQRSDEALTIDIAAGNDFPDDLRPYDLIIHCGACTATRHLVQTRTRKALLAGVPITNYGIALAKLQGLLDRIAIPGSRTPGQSS